MQKTIGIDVETTKIPFFFPWQKEAYLVSVGIAFEANRQPLTWIFNHKEDPEANQRQAIDEIQQVIDWSDRLVGHNLKFDLNWLSSIGINFEDKRLYCTKAAEYLINGQLRIPYSLKDVSLRYGITPKIDRVAAYWAAGYETDEIPLRILNPYLEQDCINTLAIYQRQAPLIRQKGLVKINAVTQELQRVLSEIEMNGMPFSKEAALGYIETLQYQNESLHDDLIEAFGWDVNLSSNDDLSVALFGGTYTRERQELRGKVLKSGKAKVTTRKCNVEYKQKGFFTPKDDWRVKKKGFFKTDKKTIKVLPAKTKVQKMIKKNLLEMSVVKKALETFEGDDGKGLINKVQADGCVHPQYNQTRTRTGRLSSKDPNGQNFPRKGTSPIKKVFISKLGQIVNVDLAQLEWRVCAFLSQDPVMMKEIRDGIDAHGDNAEKIFGVPPGHPKFKETRQVAKIFTFRMIYGGSPYSFYMDQEMPNFSLKKWERIVSAFYEKYQGLKQWQDDNIDLVNRQGFLTSHTGRILQFTKSKNRYGVEEYRDQQIKNYPVQSLATADIMPLCMVLIRKMVRKNFAASVKLIGQVHDSIVADVAPGSVKAFGKMCVEIFESLPQEIERIFGFKFNVPLTGDVEVGPNYGEMKEMEV